MEFAPFLIFTGFVSDKNLIAYINPLKLQECNKFVAI